MLLHITVGWGSGDPHYFTFDNRYFTFNGFGEFTLLEAISENNRTFNLQGRLGTVSFWRVTTHLGFAFGHQHLAFQVSVYNIFNLKLTYDSGLLALVM